LSPKQKLVLRDIWLYAAMLFVITAVVGLLLSNFTILVLAPVSLVCIVGALLLHLATLQRFSRARRNGTEPDTTRIFG
jgi:undecaprenyl pyrophosphate phosphatase UppP